ncbi:hypothetical protein J4E91_006535 [Alternaria rosae]|nr:hypothetical protein J4E91_006535 [Alternaria rosae]
MFPNATRASSLTSRSLSTLSSTTIAHTPPPTQQHEAPSSEDEGQHASRDEKNKENDPESAAHIVEGMSFFQEIITEAGIGQTISIIHVIGDSFGITNQLELPWLIAGFSLTVGTFILFSGRLGDIYGYKRMLIIGFAWHVLWSAVSGFAVWSNKVLFIFARVLAGIGPAICLPNALAILGASYQPGRRKSMVFAIFAATAPGGVVDGACFAGIFDLAWWPGRSGLLRKSGCDTYMDELTNCVYSIAIPCSIGLTVVFVPSPPPKLADRLGQSIKDHLLELDVAGATTGILGLTLFNFAWNQAAISGWDSPECIVTLILGIGFMALFFWVEVNWAPSPLIPFEVLGMENVFIILAMFGGWASFGIWFFYTWQSVLEIRGTPPLLAVAYFSQCVVSGAMASISTGLLMHRLGPSIIMILAMMAFLVSNFLIAFWPSEQIYWGQLFVAMLIMPWGMDMSFLAATLVLSNALPAEQQGVAASLINTVVNYSISLGLGFASTVEVNVNHGGADVELGYRGAIYTAIGFAGLGLCISIVALVNEWYKTGKQILGTATPWPRPGAEV